MYLILDEIEAEARNKQEAEKRGCQPPTYYWWRMITVEGQTALNVGNGDGLSKKELEACVKELPKEFNQE